MALDLEKDFKKYEPKIKGLLNDQKNAYFKSRCFTRLRDRYFRLLNSNDMSFNHSANRQVISGNNATQSKIAIPLVKERSLIREAVLKQNFRGEPLFSLEPTGATPTENANNAQDVLNSNLKSTNFRSKVLKVIFKDLAEFGASVCYTSWRQSKKTALKTVNTDFGPDRVETETVKKNAVNYCIHILDYFQNPEISDPEDSDYIGHIERISYGRFKAHYSQNKDFYIKSNVEKLLKRAATEAISDPNYHKKYEDDDTAQFNFPMDRVVIYSTCNIKGNEDNENFYYIEMIAGEIVRFQINPHDDDIRPYACLSFYPRREYWWGNSDSEFVLPHEQYTNLLMGMKADNALRSLQQYIFYGKNRIDTADWNNRRKNGGMIGVELKGNETLNQLLYQMQPYDNSLNTVDSIMREVKESQQRLTPRPDFTRAATQGGIKNSTATAAVILEEQGDVSEALILENVSYGIKTIGRNNLVILQQRLPDVFAIRPAATEAQKILEKNQILGNVEFFIETSLNKNKSSEMIRLQNVLTAIMNFKGSGDPAFQNLDVMPLVRKILKNADIGDVDEYIQAPALPQVPGAVPSNIMPGQETAGAALSLSAPQAQEGALNAA